MAEFLDRGRSGSNASTFLTRLQIGGSLVDGRAIAALYRSRLSVGAILLLIVAALVAIVAALLVSDAGRRRCWPGSPQAGESSVDDGQGLVRGDLAALPRGVASPRCSWRSRVGVVLGASGRVRPAAARRVSAQRDDLGGQVQTSSPPSATRWPRPSAPPTSSPARSARSRCAALLHGPDRSCSSPVGRRRRPTATRSAALIQQAGGTVTGEVALTDGGQRPGAGRPAPRADLAAAAERRAAAGGVRHRQPGRRPARAACCSGTASRRPTRRRPTRCSPGSAAAGFVAAGGPAPAPAHLVLVLTGGALTGRRRRRRRGGHARGWPLQLDRAGGGAVLAGRAGSADATGAVGVARADPASTAGAVDGGRRADRGRAGWRPCWRCASRSTGASGTLRHRRHGRRRRRSAAPDRTGGHAGASLRSERAWRIGRPGSMYR